MKHLLFILGMCLVCGTAGAVHVGEVMDSNCAKLGSHAVMGYATTGTTNPRDCTIACVRGGARYVMYNHGTGIIDDLADQRAASRYAGTIIYAMVFVTLYLLSFARFRRKTA